jgi:hypothetical protein
MNRGRACSPVLRTERIAYLSRGVRLLRCGIQTSLCRGWVKGGPRRSLFRCLLHSEKRTLAGRELRLLIRSRSAQIKMCPPARAGYPSHPPPGGLYVRASEATRPQDFTPPSKPVAPAADSKTYSPSQRARGVGAIRHRHRPVAQHCIDVRQNSKRGFRESSVRSSNARAPDDSPKP